MTEDRSTYASLTTMDRRRFFFSLVAAGVAAGLGLPVGVKAEDAPLPEKDAYYTAYNDAWVIHFWDKANMYRKGDLVVRRGVQFKCLSVEP